MVFPLRVHQIVVMIVFLILFANDATAQLAIIQLHHRPAEDIIPVIAPLLDPADRISGQGFQLFVNTDPENISRVREIVAHIDRAVKQLAITVVQGEHAIDTLSALAVSGSVAIGDGVTVGVGDRGAGSGENTVRVDARNHQRIDHTSDIQRVLVQDGETATISVGLSAPVVMGSPRHKGMTYHQIVEYRQLVTGVQVTPRVSGERVTLAVDTLREQPSENGHDAVRTQQIQTRVQGRLNEWIDLGTVISGAFREGTGIAHGTSAQESSRSHIFVRVEAVP